MLTIDCPTMYKYVRMEFLRNMNNIIALMCKSDDYFCSRNGLPSI